MKKIIIIGLGNLGKRHLQSVSMFNSECDIFCFDKDKYMLDSVPVFCKENSIQIKNIQLIHEISKIEALIDSMTIVIIATTANKREYLLSKVISKKPLAIIAEKPLTQSLNSYRDIAELSAKYNTPVYINYIAHMQPVYQRIYNELKNTNEFVIYTNLPKWGIACVGIHRFELFTWLFNVKKCKIVSSSVKSVYEQKRKGFYDIAGNVIVQTDDGNICVVNNTENPGLASIQIITQDKIYNIFEEQEKIVTVDKNSGVQIEDIKPVFVSNYTHKIVEDIFENKYTNLIPDINEGYLSHMILFDYIRIHHLEDVNFT